MACKQVKSMNVYYCPTEVNDIRELKAWNMWEKVEEVHVGKGATSVYISFTFPVTAYSLLVEYSDFYTNGMALLRTCPRCNRVVKDRHGTCTSCGELALQCRQCRNINYENLDAFLCVECGYCRHSSFAFDIEARHVHETLTIASEEERDKMVQSLDERSSILTDKLTLLQAAKKRKASRTDEVLQVEHDSTTAPPSIKRAHFDTSLSEDDSAQPGVRPTLQHTRRALPAVEQLSRNGIGPRSTSITNLLRRDFTEFTALAEEISKFFFGCILVHINIMSFPF